MKNGLYSKIALNNLSKNYRFFIPRILAEIGLLGCIYIIYTLARDDRLMSLRGGDYIPTFMLIGVMVMIILSSVLMFYINSFLMKQRKREFGLYNVLGMEKRHIARVLFHETLFCSAVSILLGLLFGILFYKVCSLLICKLLASKIIFGFYFIKAKTIIPCALFFLAIDFITYIFNIISINRMKPVELLASDKSGEKEPKVKAVLLIIGLLSLGAGYYIALSTQNPIQAIPYFFLAVALVILGTYCLFITGSTFILKLLKRNSKYYYNKKHMPAVSGLLYRMKQNAVGLASIAILGCGVLVMISTTASLYAGLESTLDRNYPYDLAVYGMYYTQDGRSVEIEPEEMQSVLSDCAKKSGLEIKDTRHWRCLDIAFKYDGDRLYTDKDGQLRLEEDTVKCFTFVTAQEFNRLAGTDVSLKKDEIIVCSVSSEFKSKTDRIKIMDTGYTVADKYYYFPIPLIMATATECYGVIVSDNEALDAIYEQQKTEYESPSDYYTTVAVDFADTSEIKEKGKVFSDNFAGVLDGYFVSCPDYCGDFSTGFDAKWEAEEALYGMYGSFLFLGIILGTVFLFATVLIIYYKQISEGYEDRNRFQIMQKIGMSEKEVWGTIKSQIITVFISPLIVAGIHCAVAVPILLKLLKLLMLPTASLFIICAVISFAVFSVIYLIIYSLTARSYYKIVR